MIHQTIQAPYRLPIGGILWLGIAMGCGLAMVFVPNSAWLMLAVGALCMAVALLVWRPRPFVAHFTEAGMEVMQPHVSIPYDAIQSVRPHGVSLRPEKIAATARFPIRVAYPGGSVLIPARINVPSLQLYQFLLEQTPPAAADPKATAPALRGYATRNLETFGQDHMWAYRARSELGDAFPQVTLQAIFLGLTFCGFIWLSLSMFLGMEQQAINGIFVFLGFIFVPFGLVAFLVSLRGKTESPARTISDWQDAGLVICPAGLALVQGKLKGEMRWDEVKEIKLESRAPTRILLKAVAADISIADIYDRPLYHIYQRIMHYWRGEKV